jgi:hypothetical protein
MKKLKLIIMRKKVLILILCMMSLNFSMAQDVYVNRNYTRENQTGTTDQPYKTIQQAVDAAQEGDVIHIMEGTYREQVEIATDSITIKNYEDDEVVVTGAETVLDWEHAGGEVYRAIVPWDITENDESNQIFVDGEMIHLTRWPKDTSDNWVTNPTMAVVDGAENSGSNAVLLEDKEFDEPDKRWLNGMIWVNLANGHDGQGWSGKATFISSAIKAIKATPVGQSGINAADGYQPWAVQRGTHYYLFNPTPEGVYATGGPQELLARGEWWKNADTLYVRLPDGQEPASSEDENNLVEAKKRLWAFIPKESDYMHHVTISGLHLFAASITTDKLYQRATKSVNSHDNVIDNIKAKYLTHFIDQTGHYQSQWYGRTGIILSGVNHTLKNSFIKYSAGAAVSAFGDNHKIIGNSIYEVNYQVTEAGAINSGNSIKLYDPEIAYNFIYNVPQKTINIGKMYSSEPETPGLIHMHHNVIFNFMLRNNDSGAMNGSAGRNWDLMRIDHNIIAHANTFLAIGIYTDYGGQAILDHNLIFDVDRPIQMNRYDKEKNPPVGTSEGGPMGEIWVYNNTVIADSWSKPAIQNSHVNGSGEGMYYKNNIISNSINATLEEVEALDANLIIKEEDVDDLFVDFDNANFLLKETAVNAIDKGVDASPYNDEIYNDVPDIGAFEYGVEPWKAGPEGVVTGLKINKDKDMIENGDTVQFDAVAYTHGIFEMESQPQLKWWTNGCGTIDENGQFIADSVTTNAKVFVTADSYLIKSIEFEIQESTIGIDDVLNNLAGSQSNLIMKASPNPFKDKVILDIQNMSEFGSQAEITVYSSSLHELSRRKIYLNQGQNQLSLKTAGYSPGMYIIRVSDHENSSYIKIMKE